MRAMVLDLSSLPQEARKELREFYNVVKARYNSSRKRKKVDFSKLVPREIEPFTPMKREEIYDRRRIF